MVTGDVIAVHSHWTADGSRIVTEATLRTPAGEIVVSELGGSVDGLSMITMPGPARLELGMTVEVATHDDVDLAQRPHTLVDDVRILALPPFREDFVRTGPTKAGHYLYWESGCIFVTIDADGTKEIAGDAEFPVIDACIATWNDDVASCSYIQVMSQGTKSGLEVGNDKINLIKFRDASWCRPAVDDDPARCYSSAAAGITTAVFVDDGTSSRDGAIVDADIEINGHDFAIALDGVSLGTTSCQAELANTLTHELGHLHGLEHTCLAAGDPPRTDGAGNPVPDCTQTSDPAIIDATMYPFQDCGETKKETLEPDDINGICTVYPTAKDPGTCSPVGSGGGGCCSTSDHPEAVLLLGGLTMLLLRRRR
jgi:MYXO-CTERM domain-containing protein